jgi:hypothetical protein
MEHVTIRTLSRMYKKYEFGLTTWPTFTTTRVVIALSVANPTITCIVLSQNPLH